MAENTDTRSEQERAWAKGYAAGSRDMHRALGGAGSAASTRNPYTPVDVCPSCGSEDVSSPDRYGVADCHSCGHSITGGE